MLERPRPQLGTQRDVLPQRAAALGIDAALLGVLIAAAGFVLGVGLALVAVASAIVFGYLVFFEGTYGQTVGKRVMNIVVVDRRGRPCNYRAAAVRTVMRVVDVVGAAAVLVTRRGQRLGDLAADTMVVRTTARGARI